jgi:hypothetical protein
MASVEDRCKTALDETRTLMLGAQVLLGFQFNAFFQDRFSHLPELHQLLWLVTLVAMMVSLAAFLAPVPYDRILDEREPAERFENFVTLSAAIGLLPFALSLGLDLSIAAWAAEVRHLAPVIGGSGTMVALVWWYGIGGWRRMQRPRREPEPDDGKPGELKDKITNVLTEARMALPGAQALLGFQFVVVMTGAFSRLPESLQHLHVAALLLTALTTVLLIAPAAYHRIADDGEFTEDALRFSSRVVVASLAPLALGLCGDLYVVTWMVAKSSAWAAGAAIGTLAMFVLTWLVYPLAVAKRRTGAASDKARLTGLNERPRVRPG